MPRISVNFGEIPSDTLEEGVYEAVIDKVELRDSQSSDHQYLNWTFEIVEGEHAGRKLFMTTSLSPKSLWNVRDQFFQLGFAPDAVINIDADDETGEVVSPRLAGIPCKVGVFNDQYKGRWNSKVSGIVECHRKPVDETDAEDDTEDQLKLL